MVGPASSVASHAGTQPAPASEAQEDRFTQAFPRDVGVSLVGEDADALRSKLERVDRRIERTSKKLNRWRKEAEKQPPQRSGIEPQLTTLPPAPWRPSAFAAIDESPSVMAARTSRRPSLFDLPDSWTPSGVAQSSSPEKSSISLDLVNEPLRESLLGAPALSDACRNLLRRLGIDNQEQSVKSDLRLLDRLTDERRQIEQALLRVRAVQRGKLLARYMPTDLATTPRLATPSTSQAQSMPWAEAPRATAGYPPRLVRLVGGPDAVKAVPELDIRAVLGPQGRIAQLEPKHLTAPLMRGAWPPHRLFLIFKLWQQPSPLDDATQGLVMLVQDEVQPLRWDTLNPMRFRTDGREHNETPSFLELRSNRVIGNQQGERFLQGLERIICSEEGRLGIYSREEPSVVRPSKVTFAPSSDAQSRELRHEPIPQSTPQKSAIKQRMGATQAVASGGGQRAIEQTAKAPRALQNLAKDAQSAAPSTTSPNAQRAATAAKPLPKEKAVARPTHATKRTAPPARTPAQMRAPDAPVRGRPIARTMRAEDRPKSRR